MKLQPWQQNVIDTLSKYKDRGLVPIAGRNVGKTHMSSSGFQRLWNDLYLRPIEDLKLSEGTVYSSRYYTVEPVGGSWKDMELWCHETFGTTAGSIWSEDNSPAQRWYMNNRKFWFRDQADQLMFVMKWR
jgi:hypothetical protein